MNDIHQVEVRQRSSNGVGTASLVLGILACLVCWIPLLGILGIPVAIIGIFLAVIGVAIGLMRRSSTGGAVAGGIVSFVAILISITVTGKTASAIATSIAASNQTIQTEEQVPRVTSTSAVSQNTASLAQSPASDPVTNKSKTSSVEWGSYGPDKYFVQGDIAVKIGPMKVGKIKLSGIRDGNESKDDLLSVTIFIKNQSEGKKIEYHSWGSTEMGFNETSAALTDNFENKYRLVSFDAMSQPEGQLIRESIYPGKEVTDILVFEAPVDKANELKIELPGFNFGGDGMIRIKIPTSWISK